MPVAHVLQHPDFTVEKLPLNAIGSTASKLDTRAL
jgi:hypothetical protein